MACGSDKNVLKMVSFSVWPKGIIEDRVVIHHVFYTAPGKDFCRIFTVTEKNRDKYETAPPYPVGRGLQAEPVHHA